VARIVVYDACVLYPAPLRDLLMQLALTNLFQARWTAEIHDEWIRSVLSDRPDIKPESLLRCRELMDRHVSDCLVVRKPPKTVAEYLATLEQCRLPETIRRLRVHEDKI
jgi:hypothetical protein